MKKKIFLGTKANPRLNIARNKDLSQGTNLFLDISGHLALRLTLFLFSHELETEDTR